MHYLDELTATEDGWAFLYEDEGEEQAPKGFLFPSQPVVKQSAPNRNDKVSVRYTDGTVVRDVK